MTKLNNIIDEETNYVCFSGLLKVKHSRFYTSFVDVLKKNNISHHELENTNDIWCRDYMPIQVGLDEFIQYKYDPDYLQDDKHRHLLTHPSQVISAVGINSTSIDVVLDGGNVIRSKNSVILTDKIFKENPHYSKSELIQELERIFNVEKIIIVPKQPFDLYGHTDGMMRFIDESTLLINDFSRESKFFQEKLFNALDNADLKYTAIKYSKDYLSNKSHWGGYINYLRIKDFILLPIFGIDEDIKVLKQFEQLFPSCKIETILSSDIMKEGGVLNCITWNIYK